jgi:two-component system chemotaxis response regulator CheY
MEAPNPAFKTLEVLVCDDDDLILKIIRHILEAMGVGYIKTTKNPETAIMLVREPTDKPFDLIVCDWNMPEMSGIEVLQKLRATGHQLPFIMLTSNVTEDAVAEARDEGVAAYIAKPFTAEQVQRKVASVARRVLKED